MALTRSELRAFALPLLLFGCSNTSSLPQGVRILPGSAIDEILRQCSRGAPSRGESSWNPSATDVRELESSLPAELAIQASRISWVTPDEREQLRRFPAGFEREYVGIVRAGKRFIYGNISPGANATDVIREGEGWPRVTCDGGPLFFGLEYDVAERRFTHFGFNGALG